MNWRRLNSSFLNLFIFCLIFNFVISQESNDEKTCKFSSKCGANDMSFPIPCVQDTAPAKFTNKKDLDLLNELCPNLKGNLLLFT